MAEREQFGVRIDPRLYKALKVLAAEQETQVADLLEDAIRMVLRRHKREVPE